MQAGEIDASYARMGYVGLMIMDEILVLHLNGGLGISNSEAKEREDPERKEVGGGHLEA